LPGAICAIGLPKSNSTASWRGSPQWFDPHEELCAVTLLASRQDKSPALIFEKMQGDTTGSRIPYKHAWRQQRALRAGGGARSIRKHA
jgi:hypothetical protein